MNGYDSDKLQDEIDLVAMFGGMRMALQRHWKMILSILIICAATGFCKGYFFTANQFSTSATYLLRAEEGADTVKMAEQVIDTFEYLYNSSGYQNQLLHSLEVEHANVAVKAEIMEDTNLIKFTATSNDGTLAYNWLNKTAEIYPQYAVYVVGRIELELIDEDGIPQYPVNANKTTKDTLLGLIIGIVFSFAGLVLYAINRKTITSAEMLQKSVNLRCLGSLDEVKFKKRSQSIDETISIDNDYVTSNYKEGIRILTSRVEKEAREHGVQTILVSSAIPSEGKTVVSYNLALSLASSGKKVMLLDADLRNPSQQKQFKDNKVEYGVEDVLRKKASVKQAIHHVDGKSLDVMFVRKPVNNPSEFLNSSKMEELIQELKATYEYVIIDTAPAAMLTDASEIAQYVDGALFVVKQDYAKQQHIIEGIAMLADNPKLWILGCVMNQVHRTGNVKTYHYGRDKRYGE